MWGVGDLEITFFNYEISDRLRIESNFHSDGLGIERKEKSGIYYL